jgi:hypothetical protein
MPPTDSPLADGPFQPNLVNDSKAKDLPNTTASTTPGSDMQDPGSDHNSPPIPSRIKPQKGIEIRTSTVPGGGQGLFSTELIKAGQLIFKIPRPRLCIVSLTSIVFMFAQCLILSLGWFWQRKAQKYLRQLIRLH